MTESDPLNWDNLRIFLAVMRESSLRKAAERLGVSHPTIRRRLESLEEQLGLRLFDRRHDGLHPTREAENLLERAKHVEASVQALSRCANNADPKLEGIIHVTGLDIILSELLAPELAAFAKRYPSIELRIQATYELVNLGSLEADVAIRIKTNGQWPEEDLTGRKAAPLYAALYGHADTWLGWDGNESDHPNGSMFPNESIPRWGIADNVYLQRALCLEGMGLSVLPCFMGDPCLERRSEPQYVGDLWILVHPDLQDNPRLRLFRDEMFEAIKRHRPALAGEGPRLQGKDC